MTRVVVVVKDPDQVLPGMPASSPTVSFVRVNDAGGLVDAIPDADAVFLWEFHSGILRTAWPARRRLRWVHTAAVGVDAVIFPELVSSTVTFTNSRGAFDVSMAEYALALMLALAKDIPRSLQLARDRIWSPREPKLLRGARLLVIGVGGIGTAVAHLAAMNGMEVTGVGRRARNGFGSFRSIAASEELPALVPQADYVVLAVPLTAQTRGLFSRELIWSMRPAAAIINLARGGVMDEAALIEALRLQRIAGTALDVFETEPLPADNPLWGLPNVIVSPHMAADCPEANGWLVDVFAKNLDRFLRGEALANQVDKALGY